MDQPSPLTTWWGVQCDIEAEEAGGDTLFLFLVYELGERGLSLQEQTRRLNAAIKDLMCLRLFCEHLEEGGV
jgi:hypothetical protein